MALDIMLVALAAGCALGAAVSFSRREEIAGWIMFAVVFGVAGGASFYHDLQPPPALPPSGLTAAGSAASATYTGPVTPGTFFLFMGWAGPLSLGPVERLTGTQASPGGVVTVHADGEYWFLGLPGYRGSRPPATPASTVKLPYPGYEFIVINTAGQAAIVDLPAASLRFSVIPAGHQPFARFEFRSPVFYTKSSDRTSIFAAGQDRAATGTDRARRDAALEFSTTAIDQLLTQWAAAVDVGVTPAQFAALTNPRLDGIPAS